MSQLIIFVLDDPEKTEAVVTAWTQQKVPGITILDSSGVGQASTRQNVIDEMPLMPTLANLLRAREAPHCTMFTIVADNFNVEALVAATEKVVGSLSEPNTGILFTLPVSKVWQTRG